MLGDHHHPQTVQVVEALTQSNPAHCREVIFELARSLEEGDPVRVALEPAMSDEHYLTHTPNTRRGSCPACVEQFGASPE